MADRPIECSNCKKPLAYDYTQLAEGKRVELSMCATCPILQAKLYGTKAIPAYEAGEERPAGITCGSCGTTLDAVRTGTPLGCSQCYEVFSEVIGYELGSAHRLSKRLGKPAGRSTPLHMGRAPGEVVELTDTAKLLALDEALKETLTAEDYEGAAWLRDQIKRLKERLGDRE
ncbi:MAG: hypothetical protein AB7F31_01955 [Parachlamydiales bacterium]